MTNEEAKKVFDEGSEYYKQGEYEKAIECLGEIPEGNRKYYNAQYWIGQAYYDLEEYLKAIEHWGRIPKENGWYYNTQLWIGNTYYYLEEYLKAIEHWEKILEGDKEYYIAQWNIGLVHIRQEEKKKASEAFINSQKEVFELFSLFNKGKIKEYPTKIEIVKKVLSKVLDSKTDDFFNTTIKGDSNNKKNREKYKKIFIRSLYTISLLHVSSKQEKQVAHYTEKSVAEKILFAQSKLRLSSTIGANDPKEGITLLDFLDIENKAHLQTPYQAFITCFTFNPESLNQFRLYGKEDNKEATGVSIIVKNDFFNSSAGITGLNTKSDLTIQTNSSETENKEEKHSLYRCVYIDPKTRKVISIGHKEEYNFYRETQNLKEISTKEARERISEIREYEKYIKRTLRKVKNEENKLNAYIKKYKADLDESIISELLLPLRYLTKHVAFKEEQECRIFDIENLKTSRKIKHKEDDFSSMYIEYGADLSPYTHNVIFAPMTSGIDQFHAFGKHKGHYFGCERCEHPFAKN